MSDETHRAADETIGFRPDELAACTGCGRTNAPNRASCMYCGASMAASLSPGGGRMVVIRRLEEWENGVSLIVERSANDAGHDRDNAAKLLGLETPVLEDLLNHGRPVPIARVEAVAAEAAAQLLAEYGISVRMIKDEELAPRRPPTRLRSMAIEDEEISVGAFNSGEIRTYKISDVKLVVTGHVTEMRRDETTQKKRAARKLIEESETAEDTQLVDLYFGGDSAGYRIVPAGFDFSTLGGEKSLRASENVAALIEKIRVSAVSARVVDDFDSARPLLDIVWPPGRRKESRGVRRQGFGRIEFANTYYETNLEQFTRYSRMHRHLL